MASIISCHGARDRGRVGGNEGQQLCIDDDVEVVVATAASAAAGVPRSSARRVRMRPEAEPGRGGSVVVFSRAQPYPMLLNSSVVVRPGRVLAHAVRPPCSEIRTQLRYQPAASAQG
jgi:hypothetical protein